MLRLICSYDLPHRIHTARIYPLIALSGSTVIVYGHENGIRVVWRDASQHQEKQDDTDPFYTSLLHTYDIPLGGTEALQIAFPQISADVHHDTRSIPKLLTERLVIAVACSDCNIRVICLPLKAPESQDPAEQILTLCGNPGHQNLPIPNSVSVTFTPRPSTEDTDIEMGDGEDTMKQIGSRSASSTSRRSSASADINWDLLVASHSPDLSGRLIIHRIPCNKYRLDDSAEFSIPWSTHRLQSPAVSIIFSSALYPSPHHSRLLIAEAQGLVRIMECLPKATNGPWLASIYVDFENPTDSAMPKRKPILDSSWLLGGRAIIVLLSDGEWGVWDIENAGPRPAEAASQALKRTNMSQFAIDGWVHTNVAKSTTTLKNPKVTTSKLAPMTPSTRKSRQAALFVSELQQQQSPSRGGISVIPASSASSSRADDDTVLMWHGTNIITIPSFFTHWQNKLRGSGNLFGAGAKGEIKTINNVQFNGEACNEVSLNPGSTQPEIVVAAEHRLIIIAPPHMPKRQSSATYLIEPVSSLIDKQLLAAGELDINGMDRLLDSMSKGHNTGNTTATRKFKMVKSQYPLTSSNASRSCSPA